MEPNKILQSDVLDILFEGRNKDYGAYELRKKYNKRILLALGITAAVAIAAIGSTLIAKNLNTDNSAKQEVRDVNLKQIEEPPPPPAPPPPPPPPKTPPPPQNPTPRNKTTPPPTKKTQTPKISPKT
jgi:protein TonB